MSAAALLTHPFIARATAAHAAPTLAQRCLGLAFSLLLRLLSATWRVDGHGLSILDRLDQSRQRYILACWHRHYIALFRLLRGRPTIAVTNRSFRGQVIAEICRRNGIRTLQVERPSTKRMLESLNRAAGQGHGIIIAVDGPLGPPCEVKRVVVHLAARLQCPVVPVSVAAAHTHVCAGRWDRLEVPHLFSRVAYVIGKPTGVTVSASRSQRRQIAGNLKAAIDLGTAAARKHLH